MIKIFKNFVVLLLITASFSAAAISYTITDLGVATGSVVINNSSQIAGRNFFYENGIRTNLLLESNASSSSLFRITDINENGLVVGGAMAEFGANNTAFSYDGTSIQYLGTLGGDFPGSFAMGVNDLGQIIGNSSCDKNTLSPNCAFIYENGEMNEIEGNLNPAQDRISNSASSINNNGTIIGYSFNLPFIFENGVMSALPLNAGSGVGDINNSGRIVGSNSQTAFIYDDNDLVLFAVDSALRTTATSINELDEVVGSYIFDSGVLDEYGQPTFDASPYLFSENSGVIDLFSSISGAASGWDSLRSATDINDNGEIVGIGVLNGQTHAYLLTAVPLPSALYLFCAGLFGLFGIVRPRYARKIRIEI